MYNKQKRNEKKYFTKKEKSFKIKIEKNVRIKRAKEKKAKGEENAKDSKTWKPWCCTHTHTHTSNLKKEEKRVGENPTLKVIEKKDGIQRRINFKGIRSFCVVENSSKGRKKEEQEEGKVEERVKIARRRSLGAVHTHTHTHTHK